MNTLAKKPYSSHPADHYLTIVLRQDTDNPYTQFVTHIHNSTLAGGEGGYVEGHYFNGLDKALKDFNDRGRL